MYVWRCVCICVYTACACMSKRVLFVLGCPDCGPVVDKTLLRLCRSRKYESARTFMHVFLNFCWFFSLTVSLTRPASALNNLFFWQPWLCPIPSTSQSQVWLRAWLSFRPIDEIFHFAVPAPSLCWLTAPMDIFETASMIFDR
jgi:hypothetical protein